MAAFELIGGEQDETRQLVSSEAGYTIALGGHPHVTPTPAGAGKFDIVVALADLPVTQGFRISNLPAGRPPQDLATSLVEAYRVQRGANRDAPIQPLPRSYGDVVAGAHVAYPRKGTDVPMTEQVWVMLRVTPEGYRALFHVTWFETGRVADAQWQALRAALAEGHVWGGVTQARPPSQFELLGAAGDETRLLRERTSGFSVPLPGRPELGSVRGGLPRYDAVVRLTDVDAEHGFRLDELPTQVEPQALAIALGTAYTSKRAKAAPRIKPISSAFVPAGVVGGAYAMYFLADAPEADPVAEQLWILLRPAREGVLWAVYHTTRFRPETLDYLRWGHLRAAIFDQYRWDPANPRDTAPALWPESEFALPSGKLDLTEAEWAEAGAKAHDMGSLEPAETRALVTALREFAIVEQPPTMPITPVHLAQYPRELARSGPAHAIEVITRNLDRCKSMLDIRGWALQSIWAIGNRREIQDAQRLS